MNDWLNALILGLVEGLTEFIPVSSTGHLLLVEKWLGLEGPQWAAFTVLIQLGAILAVVALYFRSLFGVVLRAPKDPEARRFIYSILIAFFPAVILGLLLHGFITEVMFGRLDIICWSLVIGGVVLLAVDRWPPKARHDDALALPLKTALGIGLFQCLAVLIPGVSRSGATIVGGLFLGADRKAAAEFSFFLAIPTMVGAFALDLFESREFITAEGAGTIALGFVVSFLSGLVVIKTMLGFVARRGYSIFGWWRIAVGGAGLVLLALT